MTDNSVIKATSSNPEVKIEVGKIANGRSQVTATYKGAKKIFLIN